MEAGMSDMEFRKSHPIQIYVSYGWSKHEDKRSSVLPNSDPKWGALRKTLVKVANEVKALAGKSPGFTTLDIRINRLRGRHGSLLLHSLRDRIQKADVFVADIAGATQDTCNPNVMIELGMALACGKLECQGLYVLTPRGGSKPSDMNGILYTEYSPMPGGGIKLVDANGFRAALRTTLLDLARDRRMVGTPTKAHVEAEDEANS